MPRRHHFYRSKQLYFITAGAYRCPPFIAHHQGKAAGLNPGGPRYPLRPFVKFAPVHPKAAQRQFIPNTRGPQNRRTALLAHPQPSKPAESLDNETLRYALLAMRSEKPIYFDRPFTVSG
jgi:hypothetical protein